MIEKPRECWSVLEQRSVQEIEKNRISIKKAEQVHSKLEASQKRLKEMYEEYRLKSITPNPLTLGMSDALNQRQFMTQLGELLDRVELDIQKSEKMIAHLNSNHIKFEIERQKMQSLDEQEKSAYRKLERQYEQKRMDEIGVMQFNSKRNS